MQAVWQVRFTMVLGTTMAIILCAGCGPSRPATEQSPDIAYLVSCNVPGAEVLTKEDNIVGKVPVQGHVRRETLRAWRSPYGEMIEVKRTGHPYLMGTHDEWNYYFVGKIVAPGYQTKYFREHIGHYRQFTEGFNQNLTDRIVINAHLAPVVRQEQLPRPGQQQQQQQQTVIMPGGRDEKTLRGTIILSSNVEAAEIYVDGTFAGNTPANLKLKEGIHIIEVKKQGYVSYRKELRVFGGSDISLQAELPK